ncbi:unnamed protein product [Pleuronectes platessa]|uniref:Uncharacterized protein n=1 Tax=Pleuronectes platessa TaxID=8262 RepID=A0A9N7UJL6_PLEPL|nr:unnamed protein product [Pleuronectes platessa]
MKGGARQKCPKRLEALTEKARSPLALSRDCGTAGRAFDGDVRDAGETQHPVCAHVYQPTVCRSPLLHPPPPPSSSSSSSQHVDDVGEEDEAHDGEKHQHQNVHHGGNGVRRWRCEEDEQQSVQELRKRSAVFGGSPADPSPRDSSGSKTGSKQLPPSTMTTEISPGPSHPTGKRTALIAPCLGQSQCITREDE